MFVLEIREEDGPPFTARVTHMYRHVKKCLSVASFEKMFLFKSTKNVSTTKQCLARYKYTLHVTAQSCHYYSHLMTMSRKMFLQKVLVLLLRQNCITLLNTSCILLHRKILLFYFPL